MDLSNGEKLILMMMCEIYEQLGVEGEIDAGFVKTAITGGHPWALKVKYPGIFDMRNPSDETVSEVNNVLAMWSALEWGYSNLSDDGRGVIAKEARPFGDNVRFPGFDGNEESEHYSVARFLIDSMGSWQEFRGHDLNSHAPVIDRYRRMLAAYRRMTSPASAGTPMKADDIASVMKEFANS
jgi:hypothetical protein